MRLLPVAVTVAVASLVAVSCKDDSQMGVADVDAAVFPTMVTRDVETLISDSGITRFRITTPVWYVYD
ncbi:MAG: LPS export ABC transporter periplasmic protein LptC, partial [Duncaniella sp.]|nr:LPS export ABC transporter periplasmic protein LptC [Duncaniella sp.]